MKTTNTLNLLNSSVAEIQIVYRNHVQPNQRRKISDSTDAFEVFLDVWSEQIEHVEEFYCLFLSKHNQVLSFSPLFRGGLSGCVVDIKIIFQHALKANAATIIVAHNHPSGNTVPSEADTKLTKAIANAGIFLDINLLDSLIITPYSFYSFADDGRL